MGVAAGGVALEVVAGDLPAGAEVLGHRLGAEVGGRDRVIDGGDAVALAREARGHHLPGPEAELVGEAGIAVPDRCPFQHGLAAGGEAERGGDVDGRGDVGASALCSLATARAARPCPRCHAVHGDDELRGDADARADLVAQRHRDDEVATVAAKARGCGEGGGHDMDAGMAAGILVALVELQHGAGNAAHEGGVGRREADAGADHRRRAGALEPCERSSSARISGSAMPAAIAPMLSAMTRLVRSTTSAGRSAKVSFAAKAAKSPARASGLGGKLGGGLHAGCDDGHGVFLTSPDRPCGARRSPRGRKPCPGGRRRRSPG